MAENEAFHFTIYQAAGMPILLAVIEGLWVRAGTYLSLLSPAMRGIDLHRCILDALKLRDAVATQEAVVMDIGRAADRLLASGKVEPVEIGNPAADKTRPTTLAG